MVLGFLGSLLICGLSLIWLGSGGHRGEKPFSTVASPCSKSTLESSPCEPFPHFETLGSTTSELSPRLNGPYQKGRSTEEQRQGCQRGGRLPKGSAAFWLPTAACRGTASDSCPLDSGALQRPSRGRRRPHRSTASPVACQCSRSAGEEAERKCQSQICAPRCCQCLDWQVGSAPSGSKRQVAECRRALGQRSERGHCRAPGSYSEPGRPGWPSPGFPGSCLDDDAGGRDPPACHSTSGLLLCGAWRQWESWWYCSPGITVDRFSWNSNGGGSRSEWIRPVPGSCQPCRSWTCFNLVYPSEIIDVWRKHGYLRSRHHCQAEVEPTREQASSPLQKPEEGARPLGRAMAEGCNGAHTGTTRPGHCSRRRRTHPRSVHDPAHVDDGMVPDLSPMLGAGFCGGRPACYLRAPGAGISFTAPRLGPSGSHRGRRGDVGPAGPSCPATGIRIGSLAVGRAVARLAWDLPRMPVGSAPGQTRFAAPGSCYSREPLQHRCHWSFYGTGVALPSGASQPGHSAHRRPISNVGLPRLACPVDHAVPSPSSTGRARLVRISHVGWHEEDASWHLHASLALPFLSLCLLVLYRVVGLCTDFRRASCRLGIISAVLSLGLRILASCLWLCACLYRLPPLPGCFAVLCELGALGLAWTPAKCWSFLVALRIFPRSALLVDTWGSWPPKCLRCIFRSGPLFPFLHTQGRWPSLHLLPPHILLYLPGQVSGGRSARPCGTRSCPLPRLGRVQQHARGHRPISHSRRAFFLLYLCCIDAHALNALSGFGHGLVSLTLPVVKGVQLMAHGFHEGRPVFSTGSIPPAQAEYDLCEVVPLGRSCNLLLSPSPRPRRQLAVFFGRPASEPPLLPCPITMLADERLHGPALHHRIALNLGSDGVDAGVVQLQSPLPGLPAEQLLFLPPDIGWNSLVLPVDLRPLGGGICLIRCERSDTCGQVLAAALEQQGRFRALQGVLGRCSLGWFSLGSQPLILHNVYALQFAHGPEPAQVQPLFGASLEPPFTLDTLMQVSATPAGPPVELFSGFSANHAVTGVWWPYKRLPLLTVASCVCGSRCPPCQESNSLKCTVSALPSRVFSISGPQVGA